MRLVENIYEFETLKACLQQTDSIWVPIYSDQYRHYINNRISFIFIHLIDTGDQWIIPFNHKDCICLEYEHLQELRSTYKIYVLNKKRFLHFFSNTVYDADLVCYWQTNQPLDLEDIDTMAHNCFAKWYYNETNINDIIPITQHYDRCSRIADKFLACYRSFTFNDNFATYDHLVIDNLYAIEQNGLRVNYDQFLQSFNTNNLQRNTAYTEYNIYTATGRPSNKFGGVNYAALKKEDGTRKSFISRFPAGMLIEMDYDSYHLRLISRIIGYDLPKESIHHYFGRYYFQCETLTTAQYEESKQITFRQIYGHIEPQYSHIKFFQCVNQFIDELYKAYQSNGYIATPLFGRRIWKDCNHGMTASKLFNYYLQATETEYSITSIEAVHNVLRDYNTKLILYTYDSLLFDYDIMDGKQCILQLCDAMSNHNDLPVKIRAGANLHDMIDVTAKVI